MELAPPKGTQMLVDWEMVERLSIDCPATELPKAKAWVEKLGFVVTCSNPKAPLPPFGRFSAFRYIALLVRQSLCKCLKQPERSHGVFTPATAMACFVTLR